MNRSTSIEKRLNELPTNVLDKIAKNKGIKKSWDVGKEHIISKILTDNKTETSLNSSDRSDWLEKQPLAKLKELFLTDKLSEKETTHIYEKREDVRKVYNTWIKDYIFKYVMNNMNNNLNNRNV